MRPVLTKCFQIIKKRALQKPHGDIKGEVQNTLPKQGHNVLLEQIKAKFSTTRKVEHPLQMEQGRFTSGEGCWYETENSVDVINCQQGKGV